MSGSRNYLAIQQPYVDPANPLAQGAPSLADAWSFNAQAAQDWVNQQRAISAQRGLWDEQGMTRAGAVDAAGQLANMLAMATSAPGGRTVRVYHGTDSEGLAAIQKSGVIRRPAFFSPTKQGAEAYGEHVVPVDVPAELLQIDHDLPGAQLLDVKSSNGYANRPAHWTIDDYLRAGHSVGIDADVPLATKGPSSQRAISAERGLWDEGGMTQAGAVDAARQTANMLAMASNAPKSVVNIAAPVGVFRVTPSGVTAEQAFARPGTYAFTDFRLAQEFRNLNGGEIHGALLAPHQQHRVDDFDIEMMHRHDFPPDGPKVLGNDGSSELYPAGTQLYIRDPSLITDAQTIGGRKRK